MSVAFASPASGQSTIPCLAAGAAAWAQALRDSGLLRLALPDALRGGVYPWREILQVLRDLCERDGGLARLLAVHHLQLTRVRLLGSAEQRQRLLHLSLLQEPLWGALGEHAGAPLQAAEHVRGGFRVHGRQWDAAPLQAADWLLLRAWHAPSGDFVLAALPKARSGLLVGAGQLRCRDVRLHPEDILLQPGLPRTPRRVLADGVALLLEASVALGLAEEGAGRLGLGGAGELSRRLALGRLLGEQVADRLDEALALGSALGFARSEHVLSLASQALAVSREAAQAVLRAESLEARLQGAAH